MTYTALPEGDKNDYDTLKQALRNRLVPGDHNLLRRQEFMGMTRSVNESLPAFELRIMEAVTEAYADFQENARDALAKEQFIRGIGDGDTQLYLLTHNPVNLRAAVQLAEQFDQVQRVASSKAVRGLNKGNATGGSMGRQEPDVNLALRELSAQVDKLSKSLAEMKMECQKTDRQAQPDANQGYHGYSQQSHASPDFRLGSAANLNPARPRGHDENRGRGRFRTRPNFPRGHAPSRVDLGRQLQRQDDVNQDNWPKSAISAPDFVPRGSQQRTHQPPPKFEGKCDYCGGQGHKWRKCWYLKQGE